MTMQKISHRGAVNPVTLDSNAVEPYLKYWNECKWGGVIATKSLNAAIALRQKMYQARKLYQRVHGMSSWDDLVIKLEGSNLRIFIRDDGILKIQGDPEPVEDAHVSDNGKHYIIPGQQGEFVIKNSPTVDTNERSAPPIIKPGADIEFE